MRLRFAASIVAVLAFSSMMIAQTGKPSEAKKIRQCRPPSRMICLECGCNIPPAPGLESLE